MTDGRILARLDDAHVALVNAYENLVVAAQLLYPDGDAQTLTSTTGELVEASITFVKVARNLASAES